MYQYSISQWILIFFWYGFIGWIWESCYVSINNGLNTGEWKWINRGFLNGPILPIYGTAAIVILAATFSVKDNWVMIFLCGMFAATSLELVTGSTMEKIFHVKYWDYSNLPLNFKGYICLLVSLFWGLLAVFLVKVIHVPVENMLFLFPEVVGEVVAFCFVAVFAFDFNESFKEAWDMRELLEKLTECRTVIHMLENRFDAIVAFTAIQDIGELKDFTGNAKDKILFKLEQSREKRINKLHKMKEQFHLPELEGILDKEDILGQLEQQIRGVFGRTNKQYLKTIKHLKRNPNVISKKYAEALKEIKELFK